MWINYHVDEDQREKKSRGRKFLVGNIKTFVKGIITLGYPINGYFGKYLYKLVNFLYFNGKIFVKIILNFLEKLKLNKDNINILIIKPKVKIIGNLNQKIHRWGVLIRPNLESILV